MDKFTRQCIICGSTNHIPNDEEAIAWQCWACFNNHWIDDFQKNFYMHIYNLTEEEADSNLVMDDFTIYFVNGECDA